MPSPPNHVGFNPMVGPDAALRAVHPKTGKCFAASSVDLLLARGGPYTFPLRSRSVPLIAVAVHARDVEEAPRHAEPISLVHGRGAGIRLGGC